jgi:hypothetical protein
MRFFVRAASVVLFSTFTVVSAHAPQVNTADVTLTLRQEFESGNRYRSCNLAVDVYSGGGDFSFGCIVGTPQPTDEGGFRRLSVTERRDIGDLVQRSALYDGPTMGRDPRPRQAFQTLAVNCCGRAEVIVLVVSGNPSFTGKTARSELVATLERWRRDMLASSGSR